MEFDKAIEIGLDNQVVIELAHRHCQLMEFVHAGGYGMLEAETGLPIDMRRINCPKANGSIGGMRLEGIATEFYRENCVGCELRKPTGVVPTLAALVEEQDADRRDAAAQERARVDAAHLAWVARSEPRRAHVVTSDPAMTQAIQDLDLVDPDPAADTDRAAAKDAVRRRQKLADRAPQTYSADVVNMMFEILAVDDDCGLIEPLRTLALHRADLEPRLVDLAMNVLTRRTHEEAARVLVQFPDRVDQSDLTSSLLRHLVLSSFGPEHSHIGHLEARRTTNPAALNLAAERAPEALVDVLDQMLPGASLATPLLVPAGARQETRDDLKAEYERGAAAAAIGQLTETHPSLARQLIPALVRNCVVPGDRYAPYPAKSVARTLAQCLFKDIGDIRQALDDAGRNSSDDDREDLFEVWQQFAQFTSSRRRRESGVPSLTAAQRRAGKDAALDEAARRFNGTWGAQVAFHAAAMIEDLATDDSAWALSKSDVLLGGVLSTYEAMEAVPRAPLLATSDPNPMINAMESYSRRNSFSSAAHRLIRALESAADADPNRIVDAVDAFMTVERDGGLDLQLRWSLLPLLGDIGSSYGDRAGLLARVLPILATYVIDPNDGLAARAITAWCSIQRRHVVPTTLEDLLPALVQNKTVAVATALMESTPGLRMGEGSKFALLRQAVMLCQALTVQEDTSLLNAAITATCILARDFPSIRPAAEHTALGRAGELDGYDLDRVLNLRWSAETQASVQIAELRLRQVGDPAVNDSYNHNDDRHLVQLLSTGRGLEHLGIDAMTKVAVSFGPESAIRGLEIAEVAWRAGRPDDALQIIAAIEALVPPTQAFERQRRLITVVKNAVTRTYADRTAEDDPDDNEDPTLLGGWQKQAHNRARFRALLRDSNDVLVLGSSEARAVELSSIAKHLNAQAQRGTPTAAYVRAIASLASLAARLLRLQQAEDDGDATVIGSTTRSIGRGVKELRRQITRSFDDSDPLAAPLLASLDELPAALEQGALATLFAKWSELEIPMVMVQGASLTRPARQQTAADGPDQAATAVVLVSIDGNLLTGPAVLAPNTVYRLSVEVQPDDWPEWATSLDLEFVGALGPKEILLPALSWGRPGKDASTLDGAGTLVLRYALPSGQPAPPFAVALHWRGNVRGQRRSLALDVVGHSQIRLRPYDSTRDALTQYAGLDERLLTMYAALPDAHYRDEEIQAFCTFFTAICREGFRLTWDRRFRKGQRVTERMFHDELFQLLLDDPELGGRVERGNSLALGYLDLRHDGITAELKVERYVAVTRESAPKYMGQPTQYAAADGRRISILVILDMSPKELPPGTPENYIYELHPVQHGMTNPEAPSMVATVVVNGNMPTPSSWSRRKRGSLSRD